jgi:serine/threonine-protein kinase HipA
LNITESNNALELDLALEVARYFRLNEKRAQEIIHEITMAVSQWRSLAKKQGLSSAECELKSKAFRFTK